VGVDIDLTPGVEVASPIIAMIDRDHDGVVSPGEAAAYGTRVLADTVVELNGERVAVTLTRIDVPPAGEMRDGAGTIRLHAVGTHRVGLGGGAVLSFRNDHAPVTSVYAVNALVPTDGAFSVSRQDRDTLQRSVNVSYDVRPSRALQLGWVGLAVVTSLGWTVLRRRHTRR
jgi:hypothetical protein